MESMQDDMKDLRQHLRSGSLRKAYRALLGYMMALRKLFQDKYPDSSVSGLYQGFFDMTYFAVVPPSLKRRGLKVAIVFHYGPFRFEAWLAGRNRQVQKKYWELFKDTSWAEYRVVTPAIGVDSIVECDLAEGTEFRDTDRLTSAIEKKVARFTGDMERYLSRYDRKSSG
jgi:hypothetical protein